MKVNNIEPGNYVGYYWMSNETSPKLVKDEGFPVELKENNNPFVIEAQLYDAKREVSYSIKYTSGDYLIQRFDLSKDFVGEDYEYSEIEYAANRMPNVTGLFFRQYWKAEGDPEGCTLCEGMKSLRPNALVFVGFKEKEDKQ